MSKFLQGFEDGLTSNKLDMTGLGKSLGSNINGIATAAGGVVGGLLSNGLQSGAGDVFNTIGDIGGMIPGPWGAAIGAGAKVLGGLANATFGTGVNQAKLNAANQGTEYLNSFNSMASSFEDIQGPLAQSNISNPYKDGWFSNKGRKRNNELKRRRAYAEEAAYRSIDNNIDNIAQAQYDDMLANYKSFGGELNTNGADFTNGMIQINNGGTHGSNPYDGVPMGLDAEGIPNLVEEGETVFNDYVFSNRLKVPKAIRKKYKLREGLTFADASKKLSKESEERPNDPISQRGLEASMLDLMIAQEKARPENKKGNKFSKGGDMGIDTELVDITRPGYEGFNTVANDIARLRRLYNSDNTNNNAEQFKPLNTGLRYAPVIGLGAATITDALGLTNKPNYSNANAVIEAGKYVAPTKIGWNPIGDYMTYNPLDRNYYTNQLNASAGATRRNILNTSGGNRAQAMAGLLAADYNANMQLGNLARQAEEYNLAQRQAVKNFNRATNQANAEGFMKAASANQAADLKARAMGLEAQMKGYQMREAARQLSEEAKSNNLSGFINSLGNIGRDNIALNQLAFRALTGVDGVVPKEYLPFLLMRKTKKD